RENEMARALRYAQQINASFVIPSAGPPCFLDDELFQFNDFDRDPTNTFPDQTVFIEYMQERGYDNGRLMIPGSIAALHNGSCTIRHVEHCVNDLFLSCRFKAERKGPYNEYVYIFFKGLSPERIQYIEGYYAEQTPEQQLWESNGYRIQRRCPHLKADLTRFGKIEDGVFTFTMHDWQFELDSGKFLTSKVRKILSQHL